MTNNEMDLWLTLWNTYDLNMVDLLFLDNPDTSYFSSVKEGLLRGRQAIKKHLQSFGFIPGGKVTGNTLWVDKLHTVINQQTAVVAGEWYFRRQNGPAAQKGPFTMVFVLFCDGFKIIHAHFANSPETKE